MTDIDLAQKMLAAFERGEQVELALLQLGADRETLDAVGELLLATQEVSHAFAERRIAMLRYLAKARGGAPVDLADLSSSELDHLLAIGAGASDDPM